MARIAKVLYILDDPRLLVPEEFALRIRRPRRFTIEYAYALGR